jgi:RNA polymerase sigma-70 factor (ECF subfamily)
MRRPLRARARARDGDDATVIIGSLRDPEWFTEIFRRHAGHIHRYLGSRVGPQEADDLLAEAFLIAFRKRDRYDTARPDARPWLYGIAAKLAAMHARDEERAYRLQRAAAGRADDESHADRVAAEVTAQAARDVLAAGLAALAPGDRDVLLLIAQEELTYEQVAVALQIPVGTVRSRLHRARARLREALGGSDPTRVHDEPATARPEETNRHG